MRQRLLYLFAKLNMDNDEIRLIFEQTGVLEMWN